MIIHSLIYFTCHPNGRIDCVVTTPGLICRHETVTCVGQLVVITCYDIPCYGAEKKSVFLCVTIINELLIFSSFTIKLQKEVNSNGLLVTL